MKIYTSYYTKLAHNTRGLVPVRISVSEPQWFNWITEPLSEVYPKWSLLNKYKQGIVSAQEYEKEYKEQLERIGRDTIINKLRAISMDYDGADLVLLCWEGPDKFCHRHILAEWLKMDIKELE